VSDNAKSARNGAKSGALAASLRTSSVTDSPKAMRLRSNDAVAAAHALPMAKPANSNAQHHAGNPRIRVTMVARRTWPRSSRCGNGLRHLASLALAALLFQLETGAQQAARIVRHAPQPGLHGLSLPALLRGFASRRFAVDSLPACLFLLALQGLTHLLALGGIGLLLGLRVSVCGLSCPALLLACASPFRP
jgi:hypothetical protein